MAVRLVKPRPVPERASADLLRYFLNFLVFFIHRTMSPLKSYNFNFKQKSPVRYNVCAYAGRVQSGHLTVPVRCLFTLNDSTKRRTGAVEV